jgi:hypothetical protein
MTITKEEICQLIDELHAAPYVAGDLHHRSESAMAILYREREEARNHDASVCQALEARTSERERLLLEVKLGNEQIDRLKVEKLRATLVGAIQCQCGCAYSSIDPETGDLHFGPGFLVQQCPRCILVNTLEQELKNK